MPDPRLVSGAAVTPESGRAGVTDGDVVVIFRPRVGLRIAGPVLVLLGIAIVAAGSTVGAVVVALGVLVSSSWLPKVEVGSDVVRARGIVGSTELRAQDVREVQLRRVPFARVRPPRRSYRFGRFSTTPIRLHIVGDEETIQITVVLWSHWPALVRVVLGLPGVETDSRTRGRLDRYG